MSVPDDLLSESSKAYVVATAEKTLVDALRLLQQQDGDDDWFLVVELEGGRYLAARFSDLQDAVKAGGQAVLNSPLGELGPPLVPVEAIDQGTPLPQAQERAESSPAHLVVVTWDDAVIGLLSAPDIRAARPPKEDELPRAKEAKKEREKAAPPSVQVGDDVLGDLIVAGDDVIIQRGEEEPTTRLGRTVKWVRTNPIISILGFVLVTLVPTAWFFATEVLPRLTANETMTGEWNVAVASFTPLDSEDIKRKDTNQIAQVFFNRLEGEMQDLSEQADIVIDVWDPQQTGVVKGATPEERSANAESLAGDIEADVVIYGTVRQDGDSLLVQPEFFVNIENFYETEEVVGQHGFGGDIGIPDRRAGQITLNRELSRRSQALALVTSGLSLYLTHSYEDALELFHLANDDQYWPSKEGREVVYLFEGNAAGRAGLLDEAQTAYEEALDVEPEYGRGYAGLASVYYLRSLEDVTSDSFTPDMDDLQQAVEFFDEALEADIQPPSADIPTKVAIGLGQVYLVEWFAGQDTLPQAIEQFELVLEHYGEGDNPRVREFAAEAHARLGLIARQQGDAAGAIGGFETAIELSTSPSREGLYWASLADLYEGQDQTAEAESANRESIAAYTNALALTTQDEQRAGYWAAISTRHEKLGDTSEAIDALEEAIDLLPEDAEQRAEYESRLEELQGGG